MERLTERHYKKTEGYYVKCSKYCEKEETMCIECERSDEIVDRLGAIEDILGDNYDLDRLRELAQADKEGRCVVMPCQPGDKVSYKSSTGFWCNAVIKDYTPENIFITAETEIPNAEPLSHTFSILEIEAALRREKE